MSTRARLKQSIYAEWRHMSKDFFEKLTKHLWGRKLSDRGNFLKLKLKIRNVASFIAEVTSYL